MEYKRIWAAYFSATGTTEKVVQAVAEELAARLGGDINIFDFTLPAARREAKSFEAGDLVVFGTPVVAGRVPNVLLKYLDTILGNGALAVPVVLYGNRNYDDALIELRNILEKGGFHTIAAGAFIGEHSFSDVLAKGRPDQDDLRVARQFAGDIAQKLTEGGVLQTPVAVNGQEPLRPYYQPRDRAGNPVNILKVKPKTSEDCTGCGTCAAVCPMGSIDSENPGQLNGICIKCGACIKKCPVHAKYYDDAGYLYHKTELELGFERRAEPELFL